jgi:predicted regulator of Ras-like GTPase activity (Roadblock/LC7/MglB family)
MIGISKTAIDRLSRVTGSRGALLAEAEAGVPILAELADGVNGTALAALAASLFRRSAHAAAAGELGELRTMQLDAEDGHIVVVRVGELLVVVVTTRDAQLGLVRLEAQRAAEQLA